MKNSIKRFGFVLFALIFALSIISAILSLSFKTTLADGATTTVKISSDVDEVLAGGSFELSVVISTERTELEWDSISLTFGPLISDESDENYHKRMDLGIISYLSLSIDEDSNYEYEYNFNADNYEDNTTDFFSDYDSAHGHEPGLLLSLSNGYGKKRIPDYGQKDFEFKAKICVDESAPVGTVFNIGICAYDFNKVTFSEPGNEGPAVEDGASVGGGLTANIIQVTVRDKSTDADLKKLEIGHGTDLTVYTSDETAAADVNKITANMNYTSNSADLTNFIVKPTADEFAKIEVSLKDFITDSNIPQSDIQTVTSGSSSSPFTLQAGANKLYIRVTSEDEQNTNTYTVDIAMGYVRLDGVTVAITTPTEGVTKNGLELTGGTFDSDTFAYNVFVPGDYTAFSVSAKVKSGYDSKSAIAVAATGCTVSETSFESENAFTVTDVTDNSEISLTATASDGVSTVTYKFTLKLVSVEAKISSIVVTGVDTNATLDNDSEKAKTEKVDYYYSLMSETVTGKAKVVVVIEDSLPFKIGAADDLKEYNADTEYGEGTYVIAITAPAGNTVEYVFVLAKQLYLKLALNSKYQFIFEETVEEDGYSYSYRRAYGQRGMEHGVDDVDYEVVILGQISPKTTVKVFTENIEPTQLSNLQICLSDGTAIYKNGSPTEAYSDAFDDYYTLAISTGMYVLYGDNEETADKVYISVLGDVTGDGALAASDVSRMNRVIQGSSFGDIWVRLAAYVTNSGRIAASDVSAMNRIIQGSGNITAYYYYAPTEESVE